MSEADILEGGAVTEAAAHTRPRGALPARCYACAAPVRGPYCWACGQKNDDCRRSVFSLAGESLRDVTSLDGRFARTVRAIVTRPGRYLRDYGGGVRSPYSPPIRFFLVVSFAFFTTLWLTGRQIIVFQPEVALSDTGELDIQEWAGGFFARPQAVTYSEAERAAMIEAVRSGTATDAVSEAVLREAAAEEIAVVRAEAAREIAALRAEAPVPREEIIQLRADAEAEVADIEAGLADDLVDLEASRAAADAALADAAEGLRDGLGEDAPGAAALDDARERMGEGPVVEVGVESGEGGGLNINGREVSRDRLADALFRLAENPRLFNAALGDWIPRIMILMIPLLALMGAVFVRGRDALLYDHALLSLNTHAVAFGLMTLGLWTAGLGLGPLFAWATVLGVPFYYARAMRGAFGRSRRKVLVATACVFAAYGLVLTTALTAAAVNAFADTL